MNVKNALMTIYFMVSTCHSISWSDVPKQPLLIHINGTTKEIRDSNACAPTLWKNNINDACACCLLEEHAKNPQQNAQQIIDACKHKKHCTDAAISTLQSKKNLSRANVEQLLTALYNDAVVVRSMTFDTSLLQPNGAFTEQSLPRFLAQAYAEKKLENPDFSKAECLKAKNLGTQGGFNTLQLFLVTSTCRPSQASMYIIKEARYGLDEATKLKEIENLPGMKELIAPKVVKNLPSISLPLAYFSYPDTSALHYIAAMPAAKGKVLSDVILKFRNDQSPQNKAMLERAFEILGKETAYFHKRFMTKIPGKILGKTMAHGDFHFFNLFYDELMGHFTFIDNETMAKWISTKVSVAEDLIKLFFMPFSLNDSYQQFHELVQNIDLHLWYDIALKHFIIGYIQAYPAKERTKVLEELKQLFNSNFTIPWVDFDERSLNEMRNIYINPLFDTLIKNHK